MELFLPEINQRNTISRVNFSKEIVSKIKRLVKSNNQTDKKKIGIVGILTFDDFMKKIQEQNYKCYICKQEFKYDGGNWCYFFPSADRIDNDKIHSYQNIQISCFFCNVRLFKGISEKKCGLCEGLNHVYQGHIPTKTELFRNLDHSDYELKKYIERMQTNSPVEPTHAVNQPQNPFLNESVPRDRHLDSAYK